MFSLIKKYESMKQEEDQLRVSVNSCFLRYKESEVIEFYLYVLSFLSNAHKHFFVLALNLILFSMFNINIDFTVFIQLSLSFCFLFFIVNCFFNGSNLYCKILKIKNTRSNLDFTKNYHGRMRYIYLIPSLSPILLFVWTSVIIISSLCYSLLFLGEHLFVLTKYGKKSDKIKNIGDLYLPHKILETYKTKKRQLIKLENKNNKIYEEIKMSPDALDYLKNTKTLSLFEKSIKKQIINEINEDHIDDIFSLHINKNKKYEIINN